MPVGSTPCFFSVLVEARSPYRRPIISFAATARLLRVGVCVLLEQTKS
jgi:hypothetical protein